MAIGPKDRDKTQKSLAKKAAPHKTPVLSGQALARLLERLRVLAPTVAEPLGLELVSVESSLENSRRVVRVVIDHSGSGAGGSKITVDECAVVARKLSAILDEEDPEEGPAYTLEVSSPGLNRRLFTENEFRRFSGSLAKVTVPVGDKLVAYRGRLATAEGPLRLVTAAEEITFEVGPGLKASLIPEI
ncbi:MAG: ribosome maturation factor RimP [Deltaproteobacteria bacterium]|jgi:ribosome maturation factor RimP|nr:ribosome maturation factor RimP [Deltaproteobacteria bacterium]